MATDIDLLMKGLLLHYSYTMVKGVFK